MASIATHYIFSNDVQLKLSNISQTISSSINQSHGAYIVGAQGPDLFFYDLMHLAITSKKDNIGSRMHTERTDNFFVNFIREMLKQKVWDEPAIKAYLYGLLTHYCLDARVHPYVYSRTTLPSRSRQAMKDSLAAHCQMESDIDELLYHERFHQSISTAKRSQFMDISSDEIRTIAPVLTLAINTTYGCSLTTSYIIGTFNRARLTDHILQDSTGLKKKLISPVEKKLLGSTIGTSLLFHTELPDRSCLNEDHRMWKFPANGNFCTDSFYELYDSAVKMAVKLIENCNTCILDAAELYTVGKAVNADIDLTLNNKKGTSADSPNDISASSQLINDIILDFGRATGGLSYHSGVNWRRKND